MASQKKKNNKKNTNSNNKSVTKQNNPSEKQKEEKKITGNNLDSSKTKSIETEKKNESKELSKEEKVVFKNNDKKKTESKKIDKVKNEENKKETAKTEIIEIKENNKRKLISILIILIVILVFALIFSTIFAMIHSTRNTIAKGVKINNIDISGLTYDEAKNKLDEAFKTILDVNIELNYKDKYSHKIKPEDIELSYDFKNELEKAYSVGRKGNIIECNYSLISTALKNQNINIKYKFNENYINSIIDEVSTGIPDLVTQCSHYIEEDNLIIKSGKDGIQVDKDKLRKLIENSLNNRNPIEIIKNFKNEKIEIPYTNVSADEIDIDKIYSEVHTEPKDAYFEPATETEKAKIYADVDGVDFAISIDEAKEKLKEDLDEYVIPLNRKKANVTINDIGLEAFPNKLQEFSTRYDASNIGRSENLRIATSKIDGTVLMPGQQFSFNGVVGERTVQEGYQNAAIYEGDSVVDGLAGGICQVSSTLYNVALLANLQIDERYNHSFKTSYLEVGRDATVVYGIKDFKFTNSRSYPIKIEGSAENGVVYFAIYGIEEDVEYKINIIPVITSTIPFDVQTIQDNTLAPETQMISQVGSPGYNATTYKETVLNGTVISKEILSTDVYKAMARIVKVGPASTPTVTTPTPTPAPTSTPAPEATPTPAPTPAPTPDATSQETPIIPQ